MENKVNEIGIRVMCGCGNSFDPQLEYEKRDKELVAYVNYQHYKEYICARCGKTMSMEVTHIQKETYTTKNIVTESKND